MPSTSERLRSLTEGLFIATRDGNIAWNVTSDNNIFESRVGSSRIEVNSEPGNGGSEDIRITIYDANGVEADTFTDNYFRRLSPKNVQFDDYFSLMIALLEGARRNATGADKVVDGILEILNTPLVSDEPDF